MTIYEGGFMKLSKHFEVSPDSAVHFMADLFPLYVLVAHSR